MGLPCLMAQDDSLEKTPHSPRNQRAPSSSAVKSASPAVSLLLSFLGAADMGPMWTRKRAGWLSCRWAVEVLDAFISPPHPQPPGFSAPFFSPSMDLRPSEPTGGRDPLWEEGHQPLPCWTAESTARGDVHTATCRWGNRGVERWGQGWHGHWASCHRSGF